MRERNKMRKVKKRPEKLKHNFKNSVDKFLNTSTINKCSHVINQISIYYV